MGIGEAAVTILDDDGVPTPVVHTRLRAPAARIGPADDVAGAAQASPLFAKYGTRLDAESAREKLEARMEQAAEPEGRQGRSQARPRPRPRRRRRAPRPRRPAAPTRSATSSPRARGKAIQRQVVRGVFGMLQKRL